MGDTIDGDSFQTYYEPYQQDKTTVEIRLSSQGETLDWIVGYYHEEITDDWQAPFAPPTAGGDGRVNLYGDSMSVGQKGPLTLPILILAILYITQSTAWAIPSMVTPFKPTMSRISRTKPLSKSA